MPSLNLKTRQRQPEVMDQPDLDQQKHRSALEGLQRVNGISRIGGVLWRAIDRVILQHKLEKVRVLDLASGGGDLAIWLARKGQGRVADFSVTGYDISPTAISYATEKAQQANVRNVEFVERNVLSEPTDQPLSEDFDIVMCSLFLHHLEEEYVVSLLQKMASITRHAVIVDDLRRTRFGYVLAWAGCRLLTRSPVVHIDGPMSVEGAFTVGEVQSLAKQAGLSNAVFTSHWPQRFLMTWQKIPEVNDE